MLEKTLKLTLAAALVLCTGCRAYYATMTTPDRRVFQLHVVSVLSDGGLSGLQVDVIDGKIRVGSVQGNTDAEAVEAAAAGIARGVVEGAAP